MNSAKTTTVRTPASPMTLRVWPGVVIVALQWLATFGSGLIAPGTTVQMFGMMGGPSIGTLLLLLWWLLFSRAAWGERLAALGLLIASGAAAVALAHESMQMVLAVYGLPVVCLAFVACAVVCRSWNPRPRRLAMAVTILVSCLGWTLVRSEGVTGAFSIDLASRWGVSAEDRYLAARSEPVGAATTATAEVAAETIVWPGFRGPDRDGQVRGTRLATDWTATPPKELWRRPIGPGWSSFAVAGNRLYTQEQQGDDEVVSCHDALTGEPIWQHRDPARFWESLAGAGPRATPSLSDGRVYTVGATGILNALDAGSGALSWSRNLVTDTGAKLPDWGFSASPLVVDDLLVVHAGGPDGKGMVAYDRATGEPRWFAPASPLSYSSAHLATIDGVRQLLILTGAGAQSYAPSDGAVLWEHSWPIGDATRIVQPALTDDGSILIGTGFGLGLRKLGVSQSGGTWTATELWTSQGLKPYFNDLVIDRGHAYGFDGRILSCVELEHGERLWKGGRYGYGQALLLTDQHLLLILSESGELALVAADPTGFREFGKIEALKGKTWNHPVLDGDVVYVRNGEEMAAFRLPLAPTTPAS